MHGSKRAMAEPQLGAPATPRDGRAVAARAASRPAGGGRHAGGAAARKRSRGEMMQALSTGAGASPSPRAPGTAQQQRQQQQPAAKAARVSPLHLTPIASVQEKERAPLQQITPGVMNRASGAAANGRPPTASGSDFKALARSIARSRADATKARRVASASASGSGSTPMPRSVGSAQPQRAPHARQLMQRPRSLSPSFAGVAPAHVQAGAHAHGHRRHPLSAHVLRATAGMANLGNTCYVNATLQMLLALPAFTEGLVAAAERLAEDGGSGGPDGSVVAALVDVLHERRVSCDSASRPVTVRPAALKRAVEVGAARFCGTDQQDAHEFLLSVLERVQEEVFEGIERPKLAAGARGGAEGGADNKRHANLVRLTDTLCPVSRTMSTFVEHSMTCQSCGHVATRTELFSNLSLDLPRTLGAATNVTALLKNYFEGQQTLERTCEECGQMCPSTVRSCIRRLPRLLILHFKRFSSDATGRVTKRRDPVRLPEVVNLADFSTSSTAPPPPAALAGRRGGSARARTSAGSGTAALERQQLQRALAESLRGTAAAGDEDRNLADAIAASLQDAGTTPSASAQGTGDPTAALHPRTPAVVCTRPLPALELVDDGAGSGARGSAGSPRGCFYSLRGVISHLGDSAAAGHFVADVNVGQGASAQDARWVRCNDSEVDPITPAQRQARFARSQAYVCVYEYIEA